MAKSTTATVTGLSNTLSLASAIYESLFKGISTQEHADGGLEVQLATLKSRLQLASENNILKGDDNKLTARYAESEADAYNKASFSESGMLTGSNLKHSAQGPAFWSSASYATQQAFSYKEGIFSASTNIKKMFAAKLQDYSPDQSGSFRISEFSSSSNYANKEHSANPDFAYSHTYSEIASFAFKGLYERNADAIDHVLMNSFMLKSVVTEINSPKYGPSAHLSLNMQLTSKDFRYDTTEPSPGTTLPANGSGTVDMLKIAIKEDVYGSNLSYTGTALQGSALASGDINAIAAALFAGNDKITGTTANDTLMGFAGNDIITGGKGADMLSGGSGLDCFIIGKADSTLAAYDVITDFSVGDTLKLGSKAVPSKSFSALTTVYDSIDDAQLAATDVMLKKGYVLAYVDSNTSDSIAGSSFLLHDISGDGIADQMIELVGITPEQFQPAAII